MDNRRPIDFEYIKCRLMSGIREVKNNKVKAVVASFYSILSIIWMIPKHKAVLMMETVPENVMPMKAIIIIFGALIMIYAFGAPLNSALIDSKLMKIGLVNRWGEPPHLVKRYEENNAEIWVFYVSGISVDDWDRIADKIETSLNMIYVKCEYLRDREHISVYLVSPDKGIPPFARWKNDYLDSDKNIITLGIGDMGIVKMNREITPHALIGGESGCGKSLLVKSMLNQCVLHGDSVIIADKKGGVDYNRLKHFCMLVTDENSFIDVLKSLDAEREHRQILLMQSRCSNVTEYNEKQENKLRRIVLAVDEVAEWLDRAGASKDDKQTIDIIVKYLSSLARLGRATNISLVLSQQRPDASVLPGQIKAQCSYRVAGRCDDVLSQIILDSTDAAEKIPFDARGLFVNMDHIVFRGFYVSDEQIGRY